MNRRGFIQISSVALIPILLGVFPKGRKVNYTVKVNSNRKFGHLMRQHIDTAPTTFQKKDIVIVGAGIAGIAAGAHLQDFDIQIFEADNKMGGSSSSSDYKSARFANGAHYELAYPTNFGDDVISFLKKLEVIEFNSQSQLYEFKEKKFVISKTAIEQAYQNKNIEESVLGNSESVVKFEEILKEFEGKMHLPTRLIDKEYQYLNEISFTDFLTSKMELSADFKRRISYQMLDDWGGSIDQVSALAGVHYYTCRPYNEKEIELFSAPHGNNYFIEKMLNSFTNYDCIETEALVKSIRIEDDQVITEVIHPNGTVSQTTSKQLIYAGQKHALKYIVKDSEHLFQNEYSPWVTLNFVCRKGIQFDKWQNDILSEDLAFLGFVNSQEQHTRGDLDVFTVYFCFESGDRKKLIDFEEKPQTIIDASIKLISQHTGEDLSNFIEHVNINILGHAMAIPKPKYLTFENASNIDNKIFFAGADTGRLPLFFEACDSGIQAAKQIKNNLENSTNES